MGLGWSDGFQQQLDPVLELNWDIDKADLKSELLNSSDGVFVHKFFKVITPMGKKGLYPNLDFYTEQLEYYFDCPIGSSYIIQDPNVTYPLHNDTIASAGFALNKKGIAAKLKLSGAEDMGKLSQYTYDQATDRDDIFIDIDKRIYEYTGELLTSEEIANWRQSTPRVSINVLLSDKNAPVTFVEDEVKTDYEYAVAALNVDMPHEIINFNEVRYLARFVIYDKTFNECYNILRPRNFRIH